MDQTRLVEYDRPAYMTGLPHRIRYPDRGGKVAAVVLLHGRHGSEDVPWVFAQTLPPDVLLIAPRAIEDDPEDPDGDAPGYSWLKQPWGDWPELGRFTASTQALSDFVKALPDAYAVDSQRIYCLGFSQGAAAAYALAIAYPGLVAGIAGLVGFAPRVPAEILEQKPLADLPIFMAVGLRDERVPLPIAQTCRETLRAAGADLRYHEYRVGHKLNTQGLADLSRWWREQLKGSEP